jgi:ribose 5-phosphate isomerase B
MIALACDHGGFVLMREVRVFLDAGGFSYREFGTFSAESCDYPDFAVPAARAIVDGECNCGIFICGTCIGMSMAANKVPGIRAALCTDCFMAEMTRRHNDANVLVLGGRVSGAGLACKIVDKFLSTGFDSGGRHARRVAMLGELDSKRG